MGVELRTTEKFYRMSRRDIAFVKFIFEGYDGIAILTTIDAKSDLVSLNISPGCEADADAILAELKKTVRIETVTVRPDTAQIRANGQ